MCTALISLQNQGVLYSLGLGETVCGNLEDVAIGFVAAEMPGMQALGTSLIALSIARLSFLTTRGYEILTEQRPEKPPVESRQIAVIETQHANFFLLDSLQKTMVTQGTIGTQQLEWLSSALDGAQAKPAIIVAHHHYQLNLVVGEEFKQHQ